MDRCPSITPRIRENARAPAEIVPPVGRKRVRSAYAARARVRIVIGSPANPSSLGVVSLATCYSRQPMRSSGGPSRGIDTQDRATSADLLDLLLALALVRLVAVLALILLLSRVSFGCRFLDFYSIFALRGFVTHPIIYHAVGRGARTGRRASRCGTLRRRLTQTGTKRRAIRTARSDAASRGTGPRRTVSIAFSYNSIRIIPIV